MKMFYFNYFVQVAIDVVGMEACMHEHVNTPQI